MKKKLTIEVHVCDYPGCERTIFQGMLTTFGRCGHECCRDHIIRTKVKGDPFSKESCGVCALKRRKHLKKRGVK